MGVFDVNTDASIQLTAKLERLNKSAFPSAVRNTLNNAAFEMKKQIPITASKKFITRQKSFFKRMSVVDKANGWNVNKMKSITGIDGRDKKLAKNLEAQEFGGIVMGNKLVPHDDSRVSRSNRKRVSSKNFLNKVQAHNATKAFKAHKGTRNSKFVAAVMSTAKSGKKYMMLKSKNRGIVYQVTGLSQNLKSKKLRFKLKKLYIFRSKNTNRVKSNNYIKDSSVMIQKQIPNYYKKNAEFQFRKTLK